MEAYSIHIGVAKVDDSCYDDVIAPLASPIKNAIAMESLAARFGIAEKNRWRFHNTDATRMAIQERINALALICRAGDFLFISFSGHGGQIADMGLREADGMDEAMILNNGYLLDDELCSCWANFEAGVKIFMLSDCCHSATMGKHDNAQPLDLRPCPACKKQPRRLGCDCCCENGEVIHAALLSISAVNDNQEAQDGENFSKFTKSVLDIAIDDDFEGTFEDFYSALLRHSNVSRFRTPILQELGNCAYYYKTQKMFH
jgi:metacaspase-1